MSKEQIEEMVQDICKLGKPCEKCSAYPDACKAVKYAERFYNAGYRKHKEGKWIIRGLANPKCSACNNYTRGDCSVFCPNCGAKMKG